MDFERSPIRENPAQADWLRQKAREEQDRYRLRVAIPHAPEERPLSESDGGADQAAINRARLTTVVEPEGVHVQDLIMGALLCLIGLMAVRQFAPDATAAVLARLTPLSVAFPLKKGPATEAPEDERAFAEFVVAFKAGPATVRTGHNPVSSLPVCRGTLNGTNSPCETEVDPTTRFLVQATAQILEMRNLFGGIPPDAAEASQQAALTELSAQLGLLQEGASLPALLPVWQVASVLGGLVRQLAQRASRVEPHALRTVASGLDFLNDLCQPGIASTITTNPPIRLLAVDDDPISRHAVAFALKKAFNQPDVAVNSEAALAQVSMIAYDVIFLDILMPGLDGFALCSAIRKTSLNGNTPVVFVTMENELDARAKSLACGGDDFITKPFLTFEIAVKALLLALRTRLDKRKASSSASRQVMAPSPR
jgi:CheY-like chemotaxis protein